MLNQNYAPAGRFVQRAVRRAMGGWTACFPGDTPSPAVFLVHHQNLSGPIRAMALLPRPVRLWVLSPFCDRESCFRQYYGYTFTQRFGWPKAPAWLASRLLSLIIPWFVGQFHVIPVWRGGLQIKDTLRQSQEALLQGQSLLICPDQDYSSGSPEVGALYRGFLHLERPYFKASGRHLPFIPIYLSETQKRLVLGEPVFVTGDGTFPEAKASAARRLSEAMNDLGRACGDLPEKAAPPH